MSTMHTARLLTCILLSACLRGDPDAPTSMDTSATGSETSSGTSHGESTSSSSEVQTTMVEACDEDPACGPGEDVETCPEQCGVCGDGVVSGEEACDQGEANQSYWGEQPPEDACSETCTKEVGWCGDGVLNGEEGCDNGSNSDPAYGEKLPAGGCAVGCVVPGYCGDGEKNGEEGCDEGKQTGTCEAECVVPACGDGTQNGEAGEGCDDGNQEDGDGCSGDCKAVERKVFVTSVAYHGDLKEDKEPEELSGLALADGHCQELAEGAGLKGTFKAWLSTTEVWPAKRFDTRFAGLYRLTSEGAAIVAIGWKGLIAGTLLHAIDADESGVLRQENVWTNTLPNGTSASMEHCSSWTVSGNVTTTIGQSSATDATWTNNLTGQACSGLNRLYCIEDI